MPGTPEAPKGPQGYLRPPAQDHPGRQADELKLAAVGQVCRVLLADHRDDGFAHRVLLSSCIRKASSLLATRCAEEVPAKRKAEVHAAPCRPGRGPHRAGREACPAAPPSPEAVRAGTAPAQSGVKGARAEAKHTLEKAAELRGRLAALQPQGQVSAAFKAKTK